MDRHDLAAPARRAERGHVDPFVTPDRRDESLDRLEVGVTYGDVAANPAGGSAHAQLDDRGHALLRLFGDVELDGQPPECGEREGEPGNERAQQQRREHIEPARLDARPDQEEDPRADQQAERALAQAHALTCLERRAAGSGPPRAIAR